MKLHYAAAGVLLALSPLSASQAANIGFYGQIHVSVDHLDNDVDSGLNISSNSSRIGVKASMKCSLGSKLLARSRH
ncbi:hypothetical protein [Alishewanella sp. WH16-1]|uniref:hypothetical protein n=1 Tax=Alishewanella sp. WH16-1 TaxID=1651088 RepID=UPI000A682271|nr:hypothetical protein [Alishewanella sp. WH16-1]